MGPSGPTVSECSWLATGMPASVVVGGLCACRCFIAPLFRTQLILRRRRCYGATPIRAAGSDPCSRSGSAPGSPGAPVRPPRAPGSCDEVGLVGHACGPSAADTDEDALVQPIEVGGGGLDPRRGTEGIQAGVDLLAAAETCEYVGGAVSDTS